MPRRKKVGDIEVPDLPDEASALLKRLIDESPLREAVAKLIDEGQALAEDLPAKGRKARKQAKAEAEKQLKLAKKKATKQQKKLARKTAGAAAEGKTLVKQNKPGLKGKLALGGVAFIGAITVSETLRSKVLDLLFGAEEEFQYTPPEPPAGETPGAPLSAV
jgi:ElaB/YqjD/DUF883 family membrane-anchored ribosome-binding protein